jgi:hypothetical protein
MYVAAIAAVIALYDAEIIAQVTDPRTGISTHENFRTFMPNSGELKAYCDEQQAIRDRRRRYAALPRPSFDRQRLLEGPKEPGHRAQVFVGIDMPQYPAMVARATEADKAEYRHDTERSGIWVALNWLDEPAARSAGPRRFTMEDLRALYKRADEAAE